MSDGLESSAVERVKNAIEAILSVGSTQQQRKAAHELIESVKQQSIHSAAIGLSLYGNDANDAQMRHVGLKLVDDYIKQRWNSISKEEKGTWKKESMFLIQNTRANEIGYVKEGIARIVVEVAKREFPQNWNYFLADLSALQKKGPVQLELILLVLLRLAEDVIFSLDPHLHSQRRKNIEQALSENMRDLFSFFIKTLQESVGAWRKSRDEMNLRLAEATLFTLSAYLSHAAMEHIFASNSILLQMLCQLLDVVELRMAAAECLLNLVERKRERNDIRMPMLVLFSDDAMSLFVEVARKACLSGADEKEYNFLKRICDVIVSLGVCQLATLWGHDRGISQRPETFDRYLKLILDMVNHPSQVICLKALGVCTTFFRHNQISKDDIFIDVIPFFVSAFGERLPKFGGLEDGNHPSCRFSLMDHDSQSEFSDFFGRFRSTLCGNLRDCVDILPVHSFEIVCRKVMDIIQKPKGLQDVILWDALALFLDAVLSHFWKSKKNEEATEVVIERGKTLNIVAASNEILQSLIQLRANVPQVMSSILLCIQAFFPFFKRSQMHLIAALEKVMITFTEFPLEESNKDIVSIRRQATASFINLCKQDSDHLLPFFDSFKQFVSKLEEDNVVTNQEYNTLTEGILLLNNGMPAEKREEYLSLQFIKLEQKANDIEFKLSLETTENFIKYVGLTATPWNSPSSSGNRKKLLGFISIFQAIVRRVQLTTSEKALIRSGIGFFGIAAGSTWLQKAVNLVPQLTRIMRHSGTLWSSQVRSLVHSDYLGAFSLNENDHSFLLGQHVSKEIKDAQSCSPTIVSRASFFLYMLHNQSYTLLGQIGGLLEEYIYRFDGLADLVINNVMASWGFLPKYRFITVFKYFFKPFISQCPVSCFTAVVRPVMAVLLESMLQLLSKDWSDFVEKNLEGNVGRVEEPEENPSDAVIEERLIYTLSREYVEMLVSLFFVRSKGTDAVEDDPCHPEPGDLGKYLLQCEETSIHFIYTMFTALTWPDTVPVNKVSRVIPHIINFIVQRTSEEKVDSSIIDQFFLCILKGLQIHGAEVSVQGSLLTASLHLYLNLRVAYPSIVQLMLMVPSCQKEQLMKFDLDVFETECKLSEKKKRECFKRFLSDAFGKNVSEIHNADIKIKDLPPLAPRRKPKLENEDNIDSICNLFGNDSS